VFRQEFGSRVAVLDLSEGTRGVTGDRTEFIGRNGSLARAAAQRRVELSDRVGPALDPCGAIRVRVDLGSGEEQILIGILGDAEDESHARDLVERHRNRAVVDAALSRTTSYWNDLLGASAFVPDRAMDLMLNRWLLYQTLSCRMGTIGVLSIERCVRVSGSAAGLAGPAAVGSRACS
jgi:cellobiose phosphorylase